MPGDFLDSNIVLYNFDTTDARKRTSPHICSKLD